MHGDRERYEHLCSASRLTIGTILRRERLLLFEVLVDFNFREGEVANSIPAEHKAESTGSKSMRRTEQRQAIWKRNR